MEETARHNIYALGEYMRANAAAIALASAIQVSSDNDKYSVSSPVSGLFKSNPRRTERRRGNLSAAGVDALSKCEAGILPSEPVAAYLLSTLGSEGIKELGNILNDTGMIAQKATPPFVPKDRAGIENKESADSFLVRVEQLFGTKGLNFQGLKKDIAGSSEISMFDDTIKYIGR